MRAKYETVKPLAEKVIQHVPQNGTCVAQVCRFHF